MSSKSTVLIIEDETSTSNFLATVLSANQYKTLRAFDGAQALMMTSSYCPDLLLLDLSLPDMDGKEIIRTVREWSAVPIIVVSERTQEKEKVASFDLGADDYVTKPFGTAELLARIRNALRHSGHADGADTEHRTACYEAGGLCVDFQKRRVTLTGAEIRLTQNEYKIVSRLARYAGRVLTYDYLIKSIWGPNLYRDNQILRVNMANIRKKIEPDPSNPRYILTEARVGYRMAEPDEINDNFTINKRS